MFLIVPINHGHSRASSKIKTDMATSPLNTVVVRKEGRNPVSWHFSYITPGGEKSFTSG